MADMATLEQALKNADAASDFDAARRIAAEITRIKQSQPKDVGTVPVDGSMVAVDDMLFGLPGKAGSAMGAALRAPFTDKSFGEEYSTLRDQYNNARDKYAQEHPVANAAASITGSLVGGDAVGKLAVKGIAKAAPAIANYAKGSYATQVLGDTVSGAVQGGTSAYGHDQNVGAGTALGAATGLVSRPILSAGGAAVNFIGGMLGAGNTSRARDAIATALHRAGKSSGEVSRELANATADGQNMFTVADALGNSGQRMLTGVVRAPGDARQEIVESLTKRHAGQGRRLSNALTEGFAAPQTAKQTETAMEALRSSDANVNYGAARAAAGTIDPTGAIQRADDFIQPGVTGLMSQSNIADDSVESAVRKARSYLTDGNSSISDFDAAMRAKVEIQNMIEKGSKSVQAKLIPIKNELDDALSNASAPYAAARDQFRQQSKVLEATNLGRQSAMRGRVEDTIPQFNALSDAEKAGFRPGYVDPYLEDLQKPVGPMGNKARPLISDATEAEFPAFAAPGKAPQLMDRIGREQKMFETYSHALGNSKTADNAADIMDMQGFDPSLIGAFATGGIKGAALHGLTRAVQSTQGKNQQTRDLIGKMLMQTGPTEARKELLLSVMKQKGGQKNKDATIRAILGLTAAAPQALLPR